MTFPTGVMCFYHLPRLKSSWVVVSGINGDGTFQVREPLPLCEECAKKGRLAVPKRRDEYATDLLTRPACASSC